jgi:hypothetical protein
VGQAGPAVELSGVNERGWRLSFVQKRGSDINDPFVLTKIAIEFTLRRKKFGTGFGDFYGHAQPAPKLIQDETIFSLGKNAAFFCRTSLPA